MQKQMVREATEKQVEFAVNLAREAYGDNAAEVVQGWHEVGVFADRQRTSAMIDGLLARVREVRAAQAAGRAAQAAPADLPDVPAGRYAVPSVEDGHLVFYQVDRPAKGKWAGYVFVRQLVGAPGSFRQIRINRAATRGVLDRIDGARFVDGGEALSGPHAAAVAFSRAYGVCAACLAELSDPESLRIGLGPVCRKRYGL
jgi:hypothetical protein